MFDAALIDAALAIARRYGARAEAAEDVAQEALLRLWSYGDAIENPAAWLVVVIGRLHRREQRRAARPGPQVSDRIDPWPGVELRIDARRLLGRVSDRARASVCLSLAGYSERESAERLGCSIKATEKSLHKARRQLRRLRAAGGG